MNNILKSPRCRQPNPYKKVTVVPIDFHNNTIPQPLIQTRSPRFNSKTKIRLVSPMKKLNQTAFMTKTNQPTYAYETRKGSVSPKNRVQIELGGRNGSTNKQNRLQSSQKILNNNQHLTYLQSSQHISPKVHASPIIQIPSYTPIHIQTQSKMSSPNKSVHINYKPTPFITNRQTTPLIQTKPTVTFMHVRRGSVGMSIPQTKSNFPTELQIRQENVIEQLKESYECDINDIKKLKEQIEQNNQEIKKLLKSSRASKETTKSKTLIEPPTAYKQTINYPTSIDNSRSIKFQKDNNSCEFLQDYQRKDKAICSKKTLISALNFQTQEKLDQLDNELPLQSEAVQTEEMPLPVLSQQSRYETKNSHRQPQLAFNNVCQAQCIVTSSNNLVAQPVPMEDSIICQKQQVLKPQSNTHLQSPKNSLHTSQAQNNFTQLKNQSLKMISSIKSLTKAVYQSDVKQKPQKICESKSELNRGHFDDQIDNIMPVSQKSIKFEKEKSQTSIPVVLQIKKSEVKIPETHVSIKQNMSVAVEPTKKLQLQPIKIEQVKTVQQKIENQPPATANKKIRKINNSIYL